MPLPRRVMHLDMDAFYAAIEIRDRPELAGKPVIVGYPGGRGVVTTCSYEARAFGVHSAMPSVTARRLCPNAIWTPGRMGVYVKVSRRIRRLMHDVSPRVEPLSIDEAFLDLTGIVRTWDEAVDTARRLKARIREEEGITGSVGLSENKFLAKVASDMEKPDGLTLLPRAAVPAKLWPRSVRTLWGVGPKMEIRLRELGISKVGQLVDVPERRLADALGPRAATHLRRLARGEDDRPVVGGHSRKSVSEERTYGTNLRDPDRIERALLERSEGVSRTLREKGLETQTVQLKVRTGDFTTWTRAVTLERPTDLAEPIYGAAKALFETRIRLGGHGVRLLGVGATHLVPRGRGQALLFEDDETVLSKRRARAIDAVREQLGDRAITRARLVTPPDKDPDDEASSLPAVDG